MSTLIYNTYVLVAYKLANHLVERLVLNVECCQLVDAYKRDTLENQVGSHRFRHLAEHISQRLITDAQCHWVVFPSVFRRAHILRRGGRGRKNLQW